METIHKTIKSQVNIPSYIMGKAFGVRAVAFILDIIISGSINNSVAARLATNLSVILLIAKFYMIKNISINWNHSVIHTILETTLLLLLYFWAFEWLFGATPGKICLRMRVVDYDGKLLSSTQAAIRSLYRLIDFICFGLVAFIFMKFPLYQRLGDQEANSLVISSSDPFIKQFPKWKEFIAAILLYLFLSLFVQVAFFVLMQYSI